MASTAFAGPSDTHFVLLKGKGVPESFVQEVGALGGTIIHSHEIGVAVVRELSGNAANAASYY